MLVFFFLFFFSFVNYCMYFTISQNYFIIASFWHLIVIENSFEKYIHITYWNTIDKRGKPKEKQCKNWHKVLPCSCQTWPELTWPVNAFFLWQVQTKIWILLFESGPILNFPRKRLSIHILKIIFDLSVRNLTIFFLFSPKWCIVFTIDFAWLVLLHFYSFFYWIHQSGAPAGATISLVLFNKSPLIVVHLYTWGN
jgi:hypothetical protein